MVAGDGFLEPDRNSPVVLPNSAVYDIAQAAVYLAADVSGYVTGHTLNVDGGFGAAGVMFDDLPVKG